MRNIFKETKYHLEVETEWTYWFHLKHSLVNSYKLIKISFQSLVHGLLPFMWKSDAPKGVIILYHEIMKIQHIKKLDKLRKYPKNERYISNDTE
jgi:hypothetical protein